MNHKVEGTVTMRLYKGRTEAVAVASPFSLNSEAASFIVDGGFNTNASAGFIENFNYTQKLTHNISRTVNV